VLPAKLHPHAGWRGEIDARMERGSGTTTPVAFVEAARESVTTPRALSCRVEQVVTLPRVLVIAAEEPIDDVAGFAPDRRPIHKAMRRESQRMRSSS